MCAPAGWLTSSLSLCSDLLMRDNLFEIITSSRTFYVQVNTPSGRLTDRPALDFAFSFILLEVSGGGGGGGGISLAPPAPKSHFILNRMFAQDFPTIK